MSKHADSFRSAVYTGGSQVAGLIASVARIKIAAIFIGVGGVGVYSLLTQLVTLASSFADLGVSSSSVREIAVARREQKSAEIGEIHAVSKSISLVTGFIVGIALVCFSTHLSEVILGSDEYSFHLALAGVAVFFTQIATPFSSLLAGLGEVKALARRRVVIAIVGTLICIPLYWSLGTGAIGFQIVALAALEWLYARNQRRIAMVPNILVQKEKFNDLARNTITNGLPFLWGTAAFLSTAYIVSIMVRSHAGLEGSGIYQSAWAISGYLVGFVLTAIGQDFYPRLAAQIHNPEEAKAIINAQIETGVLMVLPGMLLFSVLGDWIVPIFLTKDFSLAVPVVQVLFLGIFGRVINWPMLFALNAAKMPGRHVLAVTASSAAYIIFSSIGLRFWGIMGAAAGFAAMHIFHLVWMRIELGKLINFTYSKGTIRLITLGWSVLLVAPLIGSVCGVLISMLVTHLCLKTLCNRLGENHLITRNLGRIAALRKIYL